MLLAIETSTRAGSVAVLDPKTGEVLKERSLEGMQNHGASLATTVCGLVPQTENITAYALTIGPGSFTGLRIGLAFLKGLGVVHERPAYPQSTLRVIATQLAEAQPQAGHFLAALDARKKEVFAAIFERDSGSLGQLRSSELLSEGIYSATHIAELLLKLQAQGQLQPEGSLVAGGDGIGIVAQAVKTPPVWRVEEEALCTPKASTVGKLACAQHQLGQCVDLLTVEPVYHQLSAAEVNLGKRAKY